MSRPPRIAFVVTRADEMGGAQVHVRDLSTALHRRAWDVLVISGSHGILSEEVTADGVPYRSVPHLVRPVRPAEDVRAVFRLRRIFKEWKPDLVSLHSSKAGVLGRFAASHLGSKVLFTAHGWGFSSAEGALARRTFLAIERCVSPLADAMIAVSEWDRTLAIDLHLAREGQVTAIHNGMPDVDPTLRARRLAARPHLVMVARFAPPKDHALLLRALSGLEHLDWRLSFVGDGPLQSAAEAMVSDLRMAHRVEFLGFRPDVAAILAEAQVFVLSSRSEAFPRSILEAERAGLPVVASDVGGVRESVVDGVTGFVVPPDDVEELRERLRRLIEDTALRARMGAASRKRYEDRFTFDRMLARTLGVYERLLGRNLSRPIVSRLAPDR